MFYSFSLHFHVENLSTESISSFSRVLMYYHVVPWSQHLDFLPIFYLNSETETCFVALVTNTWMFSLTFSLKSQRRCAHIVEKPFQFKDSSHSDCPELRHITNNGTLTARNDHHTGSVFHNKPGSLLFWHSASGFSTHVRDRDPLPTSLQKAQTA